MKTSSPSAYRTMCQFVVKVCLVLTGSTAMADARFNLTEVAAGIFVHRGVHQDYTAANQGDIANASFVVGSRCVAVIDSGGSPAVGAALRRTMRRVTDKPVCFVISTHAHPDHVLGNAAFADDKPVFVGHAGMRQAVEQNRNYMIDHFLKPIGKLPDADPVRIPDRLVDGTEKLDLGDRKLVLRSYGPAHTTQDLTVLDDQTRTLWLGDLLFMQRIPALDGSLKGWLAVLGELRQVSVQRVIPGHGPTQAIWPSAADAEIRYLTGLADEIRRLIHRGGTLEVALATVGRQERTRWTLFDAYHKRNVTKAFAELEWE